MDEKLHIGRNISAMRRFRGLSQREVAYRLRISARTYQNIEYRADLPWGQITQIARILGIPPERLIEPDFPQKMI